MISKEEIEEIAAKIQLNLDNPQSVRKQLKDLNLARQRLRIFQRELRQQMRQLNSKDTQQMTNSILNVAVIMLPRVAAKWGRVARVGTREFMRHQNKNAREPYLEIQELIEDMLLEIDNLKLEAQEYLADH
jgi:hypothetical protein